MCGYSSWSAAAGCVGHVGELGRVEGRTEREKRTHGEPLLVDMARVCAEVDGELGHADRLDDVQGGVAVRVCEVDVAAVRDEEAEDVAVAPRGGGVQRRVRVVVEGVGRGACWRKRESVTSLSEQVESLGAVAVAENGELMKMRRGRGSESSPCSTSSRTRSRLPSPPAASQMFCAMVQSRPVP